MNEVYFFESQREARERSDELIAREEHREALELLEEGIELSIQLVDLLSKLQLNDVVMDKDADERKKFSQRLATVEVLTTWMKRTLKEEEKKCE